METLQDFLDAVLDWSFVPVGLSMLLLATVGTGLLNFRWKRSVWIAGLVLLAVAFYLGLQRHEWGEVLFNGQLL